MSASQVTYNATPERITYLVPFSYGDHSEISVRFVGGDGTEQTLAYDIDYRLIEHCVVLTPDASGLGLTGMLLIGSASPLHSAEVLEAERVEAARKSGVWEARSAWFAERAARIALDSATAAAEQCAQAQTTIDSLAASARANLLSGIESMTSEVNERQSAILRDSLAAIYKACYEAVARANNPGIAAVRSMEDLASYSAGCFIINPHLNQHTPFMGFYPVRNMAPVTWDGIFVIIPGCPGHDKMSGLEPPDYPAIPGLPSYTPGDGAAGDGGHWLPWHHDHY